MLRTAEHTSSRCSANHQTKLYAFLDVLLSAHLDLSNRSRSISTVNAFYKQKRRGKDSLTALSGEDIIGLLQNRGMYQECQEYRRNAFVSLIMRNYRKLDLKGLALADSLGLCTLVLVENNANKFIM